MIEEASWWPGRARADYLLPASRPRTALAGARPGPGLDLTVSWPAPVGPLLMAGDKEFLPRLDLGRVAVDRLNGASDAAGVHRGQVMAIDGLDAVPAPAYRDKGELLPRDRKSTRLNSSHSSISYAV